MPQGEADITIKVSERGMFSAYTGTSFTRDDMNFDASGSLRNPTGFAEVRRGKSVIISSPYLPSSLLLHIWLSRLAFLCNIQTFEGVYSRSRLGSRSVRFSYTKPRIYSAPIRFGTDVHEDTHNLERTSSLREKIQAFGLHWTTHSKSCMVYLSIGHLH